MVPRWVDGTMEFGRRKRELEIKSSNGKRMLNTGKYTSTCSLNRSVFAFKEESSRYHTNILCKNGDFVENFLF